MLLERVHEKVETREYEKFRKKGKLALLLIIYGFGWYCFGGAFRRYRFCHVEALLVGSTETCREIDVMHDVMPRMIVAMQVGRPVGSVCLFLR